MRAPIFAFAALMLSLAVPSFADDPKGGVDTKAGISLPKDPKAVVLSFDPGAGGFIRKGAAPYLAITADGSVTVTDLHSGAKKEGKLAAKQVEDLMQFVVADNDLFNVTEAKIEDGIKAEQQRTGMFIAVGGAGTSVITVQTDAKKHQVSFRGAQAFLSSYPNAKPLAQFAAVEKKLNELGNSIVKGK